MKHNLYILLIASFLPLFGCNPQNGLGLNESASVNSLEDLPENPLLLNAITMSIHPKDSSMTVLYANDLAYNYTKTSEEGNYPAGSVLYLVIWQLQADEQWFGANIPGRIKKIKRIVFLDDDSV